MDNDFKESNELAQDKLEEQYDRSFKSIEEGDLVTGKIIQVGEEQVYIDVGYKSEGKVALLEFDETPKIGDEVKVVLLHKEGREGSVIVSKRKADEKSYWNTVKQAYNEKKTIEGTIVRNIKGGFEVDLKYGIRGFLPLSKVDVGRVDDQEIDSYLNMKSQFKLERLFSNGKVNIVLSRRTWLEEENNRKRKDFFNDVHIGDEVHGKVKSFTSFGAFIDLDGFDGLLHINDMSWGHVTSPKEVVDIGQDIDLKVIRLDPEENRINLSLKHFTEDPWTTFEERYHTNDVVKGKVTKLTSYGVFIELEEGIEGLAHISELSWVRRIKHPKEILKVGDEVDVKILDYEVNQGKVSLGIKQVHPNPWDDLDSRYPEGMRIKRKIKNIVGFGAFIEVDEGIDGLLHMDDLSWTKKYKHPSELLKEDQEIEVMVIGIDKENEKIKLGLKQLSEDPWDSLKKAYPKGSIIEGEITNITDFGVFLKVQGDIEGLINNNMLYDPNAEELEKVLDKIKVGDTIKAMVIELNASRQKFALSRKNYIQQLHREEMDRYIHDEEIEETITIGDIINKKTSE